MRGWGNDGPNQPAACPRPCSNCTAHDEPTGPNDDRCTNDHHHDSAADDHHDPATARIGLRSA